MTPWKNIVGGLRASTWSRQRRVLVLSSVLVFGTAGVAIAANPQVRQHVLPRSASGDLVVGLCDGETTVEVKGVKVGQGLSRDRAQGVADELMGAWKKKNPSAGASWDSENLLAANTTGRPASAKDATTVAQATTPATVPPAGATTTTNVPVTPSPKLQDGHAYGGFTTRDEQIWAASTKAFVDQGDKIFHDAKAVGGTISVSCDMCHPNAANTHPETYPKYQVQLGRVALLRDMINWCIENPARGKPLAEDDPTLKALEAYILAQRRGTPLQYGNH